MSTSRGLLQAVTEEEYATFFVPHRTEWAIFLLLCLALVAVPALLYRRALRISRELLLSKQR